VHIFISTCFYHISPTRFGVLHTPFPGRTSYYLHKTICFLLCVVYVTLVVLKSTTHTCLYSYTVQCSL